MNAEAPGYSAPLETGGADLHIHSHYSDGSYSPADIVKMAREAELSSIALTDHDTVDGIQEMLDTAEDTDLHIVPGVEISCKRKDRKYHVLGYYIDWESPELVERLKYFEKARADRIRRMVKVLQDERNINLTYESIEALAGKSLIGKPHVAQALVNNGLVEDFRSAFEEFLGDGQILDRVPKERMSFTEAVERINKAGGVPVLAHPVHYEDNLDFADFKEDGISGIEVFYSDHDQELRQTYFQEADNLDLIITGGSDFHGDAKPDVELGDIRLPESYLDALQEVGRKNGMREDILSS